MEHHLEENREDLEELEDPKDLEVLEDLVDHLEDHHPDAHHHCLEASWSRAPQLQEKLTFWQIDKIELRRRSRVPAAEQSQKP